MSQAITDPNGERITFARHKHALEALDLISAFIGYETRERAEMCAEVAREVFGYTAIVQRHSSRQNDLGWGVVVTKDANGHPCIDRSELTRLEGVCMLLARYAITLSQSKIVEQSTPSPEAPPGPQLVRRPA